MADKLVTNELSSIYDEKHRKMLISNFKIIQTYLDKIDSLTGEFNSNQENQNISLDDKLNDMQKNMDEKIKRITLGTDEDTIRLVVTAILQEQEVIK